MVYQNERVQRQVELDRQISQDFLNAEAHRQKQQKAVVQWLALAAIAMVTLVVTLVSCQ